MQELVGRLRQGLRSRQQGRRWLPRWTGLAGAPFYQGEGGKKEKQALKWPFFKMRWEGDAAAGLSGHREAEHAPCEVGKALARVKVGVVKWALREAAHEGPASWLLAEVKRSEEEEDASS